MIQLIFPLLLGGQEGAPAPAGSAGIIANLLPFVLIVAIFYFLIIRPQNKSRKEAQKMLSAMKKGDKVVTAGGIHGILQSVKEATVIVKVDENTKIEFSRASISSVNPSKSEKPEEKGPEQIEEKSGDNSE